MGDLIPLRRIAGAVNGPGCSRRSTLRVSTRTHAPRRLNSCATKRPRSGSTVARLFAVSMRSKGFNDGSRSASSSSGFS